MDFGPVLIDLTLTNIGSLRTAFIEFQCCKAYDISRQNLTFLKI